MATQFSILAKVKVDTADIQRQLDSLKDNTINIHANTHDFEMSISVANAVMREFVELAESMVEQVYALDTSLTEFKKVSDLRGTGLDEYVEQLGELGQITARTTSEMVDAATEFKKSGFSEEDSKALALVATEYQNVADEAISAGEAANFIISQMKAFNLTAADSQHIIDAVDF